MSGVVQRSVRALQTELKELQKCPVEGCVVRVLNEDNLFKWDVGIFGPPDTLYEGGYFKAILTFPNDYPYNPPKMHFTNRMFHPNIFENGEVCISILHSPGEDPSSDELPSERWNPTQSVRTILLSVISMLNEPNVNSAANVDASVAYRKWKESHGTVNDYVNIIKKSVQVSKMDALREQLTIPLTLEDYRRTGQTQIIRGSISTCRLGLQLQGNSDHCNSAENDAIFTNTPFSGDLESAYEEENFFLDDADDPHYLDDDDDDEDCEV